MFVCPSGRDLDGEPTKFPSLFISFSVCSSYVHSRRRTLLTGFAMKSDPFFCAPSVPLISDSPEQGQTGCAAITKEKARLFAVSI